MDIKKVLATDLNPKSIDSVLCIGLEELSREESKWISKFEGVLYVNATTIKNGFSSGKAKKLKKLYVNGFRIEGYAFDSIKVDWALVNAMSINTRAFRQAKIKNLYLGASVNRIESQAFIYSEIEHLTLNEGIDFIGKGVFQSAKLKQLTVQGARLKKGSLDPLVAETLLFKESSRSNVLKADTVHLRKGCQCVIIDDPNLTLKKDSIRIYIGCYLLEDRLDIAFYIKRVKEIEDGAFSFTNNFGVTVVQAVRFFKDEGENMIAMNPGAWFNNAL